MPAVARGADALRIEVSSVEVRQLIAVETLDGVAVTFAAGRNGPGTGYLRCDSAGMLAWKEPGSSSWGRSIDCSAGGAFILPGGDDRDSYVRVNVNTSYLPTEPAEHRVLMRDVYNNDIGSDDVTAAEAAAGNVESWALALQNDSLGRLTQVKAWLDGAVSGLKISDDDATWVDPTTEAAALALADIAPGANVPLYLERTIGAAALAAAEVLNHLHLTFAGL